MLETEVRQVSEIGWCVGFNTLRAGEIAQKLLSGLKKCIPTTFSGLLVTSARADMLNEEVFDAIMTFCG